MGRDVTIVAFSLMVEVALQAADALMAEGIDVVLEIDWQGAAQLCLLQNIV